MFFYIVTQPGTQEKKTISKLRLLKCHAICSKCSVNFITCQKWNKKKKKWNEHWLDGDKMKDNGNHTIVPFLSSHASVIIFTMNCWSSYYFLSSVQVLFENQLLQIHCFETLLGWWSNTWSHKSVAGVSVCGLLHWPVSGLSSCWMPTHNEGKFEQFNWHHFLKLV